MISCGVEKITSSSLCSDQIDLSSHHHHHRSPLSIMDYTDDRFVDEDGEPLMDMDERAPSDNEEEQEIFGDDIDYSWREERSPTPVHDATDPAPKPRKRLIKKTVGDSPSSNLTQEKWETSEPPNKTGSSMKQKLASASTEKSKLKKRGKSSSRMKFPDGDPEMNEMWETIAPPDPEDDQEGPATIDDDNFIDDTGLDPADRFGSDGEARSPSRAPQASEGEEDEEINRLFKIGRKKKKPEKTAAEIALLVENVMAELEVTAEEDAELNRESKPAVSKLKKLPYLTEVLAKKQLQQEFLDHGVLTLLRNWLEPLPDGSLPNITIRAAILNILHDLPIDLDQFDRREQLKRSGLGRVVMFLSKSDEETTSNRKLAKELVDKWSRPIFNKSTRFEDMRNYDDERAPRARPAVKKNINRTVGFESRDIDLDFSRDSRGSSSKQQGSSKQISRPEPMAMDFLVRPQSKIDPEEVRARAKQAVQDQRRVKMNKKLQQLKAAKRQRLQATKVSVEGRNMVKYL